MACRGVLFAITDHKISKLEAAQGDDEVMNVVQMEIEQPWDETWLYQLDKTWDAIHRCVTDGRIGFTNGEFPLGLCIRGGRQLALWRKLYRRAQDAKGGHRDCPGFTEFRQGQIPGALQFPRSRRLRPES